MHKKLIQYNVLVVDDNPVNIELLGEILSSEYKVKAATNGQKALDIAHDSPQPDLILLDVMMPGINGFETCSRLKSDPQTKSIPVIFITALNDISNEEHGFELGAVDYISKPFNPSLVKARVHNHIELKRHQDELEVLVNERTLELEQAKEVVITAMGTLAEYRDPETGAHILRTKNYVRAIAQCLSHDPCFSDYLDSKTIELFYKSAPLHDIGKVAIPDHILLKPGKLTVEEFEQMKQHPIYGRDALLRTSVKLGENSFLVVASDIAIGHHEKWDGSGYPYALKGDAIPLSARIMALADVYDALISKRVYKPAFSHEKAMEIIIEGKGHHFDPVIVEAFLSIEREIKSIALSYKDQEN
jgi:cyclic di-GMP phosphodiesterase